VSDHDRKFFDTFMLVIGTMLLVTIMLFFLARHLSGETQEQWNKEDPYAMAATAERLKPVGRVVKSGEAEAEPAPAAAAQAEPVALSGADIYNQVCSACHGAGVAGAPKVGDNAAWSARISKGTETLVKHAIEGFQGTAGYMPPKGGRVDLPDAEIQAAVEYMLEHSK
jgi:cytochrome c5